jgi:DNA-binding NarL/FixJ family response regulator
MAEPMTKLRIFLADDHAVVREGLKALINAHPDMEVVGEAGDGRTACDRAAELRPDVVVMDVSMPDMNGVQATRELHVLAPAIRVVALTVHEDRSFVQQLLAAGASGYVLKRAAAEELVHAIRVVARGEVYLDPVVAASLVQQLARRRRTGVTAGVEDLSDREAEVLRLIAQGHSNKEIAARLELSVKTVETYKARSMEKLSLTGRADIVRLALEKGWLQEPDKPA